MNTVIIFILLIPSAHDPPYLSSASVEREQGVPLPDSPPYTVKQADNHSSNESVCSYTDWYTS